MWVGGGEKKEKKGSKVESCVRTPKAHFTTFSRWLLWNLCRRRLASENIIAAAEKGQFFSPLDVRSSLLLFSFRRVSSLGKIMHEETVSWETSSCCDNKAWTIRNLNLFIFRTQIDNKGKDDMKNMRLYMWSTWKRSPFFWRRWKNCKYERSFSVRVHGARSLNFSVSTLSSSPEKHRFAQSCATQTMFRGSTETKQGWTLENDSELLYRK